MSERLVCTTVSRGDGVRYVLFGPEGQGKIVNAAIAFGVKFWRYSQSRWQTKPPGWLLEIFFGFGMICIGHWSRDPTAAVYRKWHLWLALVPRFDFYGGEPMFELTQEFRSEHVHVNRWPGHV